MKVKQLETNDVRRVYEAHLTLDYPARERKPLKTIQAMRKRGVYDCYAMVEEDLVVAYAFLCQKRNWMLLDYYTVAPPFRGQGYGSRLVGGLRLFYPRMGLLAPVRDPEQYQTPEETRSCQRHINFYQKLGFTLTPIRVTTPAGDYRILVWPTQDSCPTTPELVARIQELYGEMLDSKDLGITLLPPENPLDKAAHE